MAHRKLSVSGCKIAGQSVVCRRFAGLAFPARRGPRSRGRRAAAPPSSRSASDAAGALQTTPCSGDRGRPGCTADTVPAGAFPVTDSRHGHGYGYGHGRNASAPFAVSRARVPGRGVQGLSGPPVGNAPCSAASGAQETARWPVSGGVAAVQGELDLRDPESGRDRERDVDERSSRAPPSRAGPGDPALRRRLGRTRSRLRYQGPDRRPRHEAARPERGPGDAPPSRQLSQERHRNGHGSA